MFRLKDRNGRDMCLGMTHEEVIAWLAAKEIRSYRDLPQIWYQIQTKERDEAGPRSGVLRTREFVMKDAYTLDPTWPALERSYDAHKEAYRGSSTAAVSATVVESDPGMMGGSAAARVHGAERRRRGRGRAVRGVRLRGERRAGARACRRRRQPPRGDEEVATPNVRTIAEVAPCSGSIRA